jgi:ribosome-binding factor A
VTVSRRLARIGGQIQEEVSEIISRRLRDPRLGFVTLTGVKVSADLSYASIYISVMGSEDDVKRSIACLDGARSYIRSELGRRLRFKHVPEIRFHQDDSCRKGARIESILKDLKEHRDDGSIQEDS